MTPSLCKRTRMVERLPAAQRMLLLNLSLHLMALKITSRPLPDFGVPHVHPIPRVCLLSEIVLPALGTAPVLSVPAAIG